MSWSVPADVLPTPERTEKNQVTRVVESWHTILQSVA